VIRQDCSTVGSDWFSRVTVKDITWIEANMNSTDFNWEELSSDDRLTYDAIDKYADSFSWFRLSYRKGLTEEFMDKYQHRLSWRVLSRVQKMSPKFINKFKHKIVWSILTESTVFNESMLYQFEDYIDWSRILKTTPTIPDDLIDRHVGELVIDHWTDGSKLTDRTISLLFSKHMDHFISKHKLPDNVIQLYAHTFTYDEWAYIVKNGISSETLRTFKEIINWDAVSMYYKFIDDAEVVRFKNYINWNVLIKERPLSDHLFKHINISIDWNTVTLAPDPSETLIEWYSSNMSHTTGNRNWDTISSSSHITEDLLRILSYHINFDEITIPLTEEFVDEFNDKIKWTTLKLVKPASYEFIEKYKNKIAWFRITRIHHIDDKLVYLFSDFIEWDYLMRNGYLDNDTIIKYADKFNAKELSIYAKLSESDITLFLSKRYDLDFRAISITQRLSEPFIEKWFSCLDRELISFFQPLSDNFIEKHKSYLSLPLIERSRSMSGSERMYIRNAFIDISRRKLQLVPTLDIIKHLLSDQFK
jgi:hypothetical protein